MSILKRFSLLLNFQFLKFVLLKSIFVVLQPIDIGQKQYRDIIKMFCFFLMVSSSVMWMELIMNFKKQLVVLAFFSDFFLLMENPKPYRILNVVMKFAGHSVDKSPCR